MPSTAPDMNTPGMPKTNSPFADEPSLIDAMASAVEKFYIESGGKQAFECENPGQTFGWKIDSKGVRLVDCGCYTEAVWPIILSLGIGPILTTIGTQVGKKITKKLYLKYAKILQNDFIRNAVNRFSRNSLLIRQGMSKMLKLPPSKPGYIRIWRGEGSKIKHKELQCLAKDVPQTTSGRWGSPRRGLSEAYAEGSGTFVLVPGKQIPIVSDSDKFLYYLDLPIDEAKKLSPGYQGPGAKWPFLLDDPTNLGDDVRVILGPVFDGKGKRLGEVKRLEGGKVVLEGTNGKIYDAAAQNFHKANDIQEIIGYTPEGLRYTLPKPTVITRKTPSGDLEKVLDIPGPGDMDLNPQLFPYTEEDALKEVFLTDEWMNKFRISKPDATDEILDEIICKETLLKNSMNKLGGDINFAEQFLDPANSNFRQQYQKELFDLADSWGDTIKKYADEETIMRTDFHIDDIKEVANFSPEVVTSITLLLQKFSGLLMFLLGILSYFTIVVDKECSNIILDEAIRSNSSGPSDRNLDFSSRVYAENVVDAIFFNGKWKGFVGSNYRNGLRYQKNVCSSIADQLGSEPSWEKIYAVLVNNKLPVWPNITDSCECSDCPPGYELCSYSSLINLYTDTYNICLPVCGGQTLKPPELGGIITRANCEIGCPDGYSWVECYESDCPNDPCNDNVEKGFCAKIPEENLFTKYPYPNDPDRFTQVDPKYGPLLWDPVSCKWVCKSYNEIQEIITPEGVVRIFPSAWIPRFTQTQGVVIGPGGSFPVPVTPLSPYELVNMFIPNKILNKEPCSEETFRNPENDCKCSSGSYDDESIGIPEVPEGYILFDNNIIPIVDETE